MVCSFLFLSLSPKIFALFSPVRACTRSHPAELRRQRSLSPRFLLKMKLLNTELHLSELSDQLDVTLESSKKSNWLSPGSRRPKAMQSNKDHAVYSDLFSSKRKYEPKGYHAVCVQYVALSCCLSAKQMAKSKQCKVPTNEDQRLDHATKLPASLARKCRCHCTRDRGKPAMGTEQARLQETLPRRRRSDCS